MNLIYLIIPSLFQNKMHHMQVFRIKIENNTVIPPSEYHGNISELTSVHVNVYLKGIRRHDVHQVEPLILA